MKMKITHKTGAVIIKDLAGMRYRDCIDFECIEPIFLEFPAHHRLSWCKFCDYRNVERIELIA